MLFRWVLVALTLPLVAFADATSAADWYKRGMAATASGNHAEAYQCFRKAVAIDPESASLRINLAAAAARIGRPEEAIEALRAVIGKEPRQATALYNLGSLYLEAGKPGEALPLFRRLVKLAPQDQPARRQELIALARTAGEAELRTALAEAEDHGCEASLGLGQELLARHYYELAARQFRRERTCAPSAEQQEAKLGEASALLAWGKSEEAVSLLQPEAELLRRSKHARWILGSAFERLAQYPEAFEQFAAAVDIDPGDPRAYMPLGLLGLKTATPQLSLKVFEDASGRFPQRPEFRLGQALAAQVMGNAKQAEEDCRALVAAHPGYPPARLFLASLHLDSGRFEEAVRDLDGLPGHAGSNLLATYLRASALLQAESQPGQPSRRLAEAMRALETALGGSAEYVNAYVLLARYHRSAGETERADELLNRAIESAPGSWQARLLLANSHRSQGRLEQARQEILESEELRRRETHAQSMLKQLFYGDFESHDQP